ncbi:MAG: metal-dependent hydrolase, partial [Candidatus Hodarchaeota archaeon]
MPPTGFHGILGLLFCFRIDSKHKDFRIGLAWGSVLPDLDLLGSALIFLLTLNTDLTLAFHRSVTHSLIIIICILSTAFLLQFKCPKARTTYVPLIIGIISGMILHISLDMFYWDGVSLLWPLQLFGERITIIPFTYRDLSPLYNSLSSKLIAVVDGHFELLFFLFLSYLANKYNTDQQL